MRPRFCGSQGICAPRFVILSLFGLAVGKAINVLEARLLHWR